MADNPKRGREPLTIIKPTTSIVRFNLNQKEIRQPCHHVLNSDRCVIPGLDADFCQTCRIYWVDEYRLDLLLNKRKSLADLTE
jgi:hypothetical protein